MVIEDRRSKRGRIREEGRTNAVANADPLPKPRVGERLGNHRGTVKLLVLGVGTGYRHGASTRSDRGGASVPAIFQYQHLSVVMPSSSPPSGRSAGSGLPRVTSSPVSVNSRLSRQGIGSRMTSTNLRRLLVAMPKGSPQILQELDPARQSGHRFDTVLDHFRVKRIGFFQQLLGRV